MTPALERLLSLAEHVRKFIALEHGPVPLVYELGEAIREVEEEGKYFLDILDKEEAAEYSKPENEK